MTVLRRKILRLYKYTHRVFKKAMPGGTAFLFQVVINYLMTLTALWLPSV